MVQRRLGAANRRLGRERQNEIEGLTHLDAEELRRHDADHRAAHAIHASRPDRGGGTAKAPLPELVLMTVTSRRGPP